MFYFRFFLCLGFGLLGIALVLKVMTEALFNDWDPMTDVRRQLRILNYKRHHAALDAEKTERLSTPAAIPPTPPTDDNLHIIRAPLSAVLIAAKKSKHGVLSRHGGGGPWAPPLHGLGVVAPPGPGRSPGLELHPLGRSHYDEAVHLASGYSYLATGRYRLNIMDHPPLAEMWAALPLLAWRPHLLSSTPDWELGRVYHLLRPLPQPQQGAGRRMMNAGRSSAS